jgi:hypothetical protein
VHLKKQNQLFARVATRSVRQNPKTRITRFLQSVVHNTNKTPSFRVSAKIRGRIDVKLRKAQRVDRIEMQKIARKVDFDGDRNVHKILLVDQHWSQRKVSMDLRHQKAECLDTKEK